MFSRLLGLRTCQMKFWQLLTPLSTLSPQHFSKFGRCLVSLDLEGLQGFVKFLLSCCKKVEIYFIESLPRSLKMCKHLRRSFLTGNRALLFRFTRGRVIPKIVVTTEVYHCSLLLGRCLRGSFWIESALIFLNTSDQSNQASRQKNQRSTKSRS